MKNSLLIFFLGRLVYCTLVANEGSRKWYADCKGQPLRLGDCGRLRGQLGLERDSTPGRSRYNNIAARKGSLERAESCRSEHRVCSERKRWRSSLQLRIKLATARRSSLKLLQPALGRMERRDDRLLVVWALNEVRSSFRAPNRFTVHVMPSSHYVTQTNLIRNARITLPR